MSTPKNRLESIYGIAFGSGQVHRMRRAIVTKIPDGYVILVDGVDGHLWEYRPNRHGTVYLDADPATGLVGNVWLEFTLDAKPYKRPIRLGVYAGDILEGLP